MITKQALVKYIPIVAVPLVVLAYLSIGESLSAERHKRIISDTGVWDMRDFDFSTTYALLRGSMAEYIPNVLLTPGEFSGRNNEARLGDTTSADYLTSRMVVLVPDNGWYAFTRISTDFSERLYVNGERLIDVGKPGDSRETSVPNTARITFTTRPVNGVIEIVQQSSNFVHREGGWHPDWQVGRPDIMAGVGGGDFTTAIIMGCYLTLGMIYILLFLLLNRHKANLCFALFCLTWFFRTGVTGGKIFSTLIPFLSWYVKFRIEYIAIPAAAAFTVVIVDSLFPAVMQKAYIWLVYIFSAFSAALFLFADTVFMSYAMIFCEIFCVLAGLYIIVRLVMKLRQPGLEQTIFIAGLLLFVYSTIRDFLYYNHIELPPRTWMDVTQTAILAFAFCEAAAVFITTMKETEKAKESERRLKAENAELDNLSRTKSEFLATMSHEVKTPLTVISLHVQRAAELISIGERLAENDEKINASLHRAQEEIMRVSHITENALRLSSMQEISRQMKALNITTLLTATAEAYRPLLEKNGNTLAVNIADKLPPVHSSADLLIQVMANLLSNANAHTKNGEIGIKAEKTNENGEYVVVTVTDNGSGISPDLLPYVFERNVSGASGTGIGLSICKEIITSHNGTIQIESESGKGTSVVFKIPSITNVKEGENE